MPKQGKKAKQRQLQVRGLQKMIDATETLGLYDVESDGRVLRELLESARDLHAHGVGSDEDVRRIERLLAHPDSAK